MRHFHKTGISSRLSQSLDFVVIHIDRVCQTGINGVHSKTASAYENCWETDGQMTPTATNERRWRESVSAIAFLP